MSIGGLISQAAAMSTSSTQYLTPQSFRLRLGAIVALGVVAVVILLLLPRLPQDPSYHNFADQRTLMGIPHMLNVVSNVPFLVVGLLGLWEVFRDRRTGQDAAFLEPAERWPYAVMFAGLGLTAFGSAYYHLEPNNARLVWDRLPMTIAFMAFFAAMIAERISVRAGIWLLGPLVVLGIASVFYWHEGELQGRGDLRFYLVVQFYPMIAAPLMLLLFPARYTGTGYIWGALVWYLLAKLAEIHFMDAGLLHLGGLVSGHTLKHLLAALGGYWLLLMIRRRRPLPPV
jgi:hypothetical protein